MKCFSSIGKRKKGKNSSVFLNFKDVGKKILPLLITFLSFSYVNSQVIVSLGDDVAVCEDGSLLLSDLNPVVSGANGDKWWETSGDGTFNDTFSYPDAVSYTPGAADIVAGVVTITLKARENNPNGDIYEDHASLFIQGDELFACNDNITIPLNFFCEYKVTPPILLEGENENEPYNLYDIDIFDEDGNIIPDNLVTGDYIGQTLAYNITHQCSWNACGGTINVRDNYHPITSCGNDTITCQYSIDPEFLGFPLDTSRFHLDTIMKIDTQRYLVRGWDACGDVDLSYIDSVFKYDCFADTLFQELIVRFWKAEDESGNISRCNDSIFVERIPLDSVELPPSWNNMDTTALQCNGDWLETALPNGYPSPDYTGAPVIWSCDNIEYSYSDTYFPGCGNTFDIVRDWTLIDWCTSEIHHYPQTIKIMDTIPPTMICTDETVVVGSDPYECNSESYQLELPDVFDECSSYTLFVHVYDEASGLEVDVQKFGGDFFVSHLPLGLYRVTFTAIDECSNVAKCSYYFNVIDDKRPYAICDQHTKINLGSDGEARLYPYNIDDGSFDNCEIVEMEIRKMTYGCDSIYFEFGPYVDFCCEESNDTLMVALRITDASGNDNSCMVEVIVEDKLPPQIICPPDIVVSCDFYFDPNDLDRYFGKVVTEESEREDIEIHDQYNNGVVGRDGLAYDNCDVTIVPTVEFDVNNCNIGKIYRTFTAIDNGGRTNPCLQTITIYNPEPFNYYGDDIIWPVDTVFFGCSNLEADTSITGAPKVNDNMCSMVAILYEDQLFSVEDDACQKIVRTWTVRDWCQPNEVYWTHDQFIMLNNTVAPTFTSDCFDREICVYGECSGLVELSASAEDDCTPQEELAWRWKLDIDNDGIYDEFGQGNHFSKTMYEGTYEIAWVVEDRCGNKSHCNYEFIVKDCKNPTPYCISDLTTVVMNQFGMVTITAADFDHGSYDNCTPSNFGACGCETELKFSFSTDTLDTLYTITCDSLPNGVARTFYLKMWVTDNAGNQDYCTIQLQVQDNNGVCPDSDGTSISGMMTKWKDNAPVNGVSIQLEKSNPEYSNYSNSQNSGRYTFDNLSSGDNYFIEPMDDKPTCLSGVSTSDVVKIQKHILGIKDFDSPYQYIAADANKSNSISAADILQIRKLILGAYDELPNNRCWIYADAKQTLNMNYPYNYKSTLTYFNLNSSVDDASFKVIKVGDVNDSHVANQLPQNLVNRNDEVIKVDLGNEKMTKGNEYKIPVYITSEKGLEGLQFTIDFNNAVNFEGFENAQIDISKLNFGYRFIEKGIVTFSWNTVSAIIPNSDLPAFYLVFTANESGFTKESISINSKVTNAISVVDENDVPIVINYRNNTDNNEFVVYQNTPNPFKNQTTIEFNIPENEMVELEIFDVTGKLIYTNKAEFAKGLNQIVISNTDINAKGVFYYTLKAKGNAVTKKMILID